MAVGKLDYTVHNYMEDIVAELIAQRQMEDTDFEFCERCLMDISAIMLNALEPQYVKVKAKLAELDEAAVANLNRLLDEAARQVKANPHHGRDDNGGYHLENFSERMVKQVLEEFLANLSEIELEPDMIPLVAAMVLNQTKPRYAVTTRGGAYKRLAQLDHQFTPMTISCIYNVIRQLKDMN
ncbi:MAG: late competence development ComFB family protein [Limnochordia bacterium]